MSTKEESVIEVTRKLDGFRVKVRATYNKETGYWDCERVTKSKDRRDKYERTTSDPWSEIPDILDWAMDEERQRDRFNSGAYNG